MDPSNSTLHSTFSSMTAVPHQISNGEGESVVLDYRKEMSSFLGYEIPDDGATDWKDLHYDLLSAFAAGRVMSSFYELVFDHLPVIPRILCHICGSKQSTKLVDIILKSPLCPIQTLSYYPYYYAIVNDEVDMVKFLLTIEGLDTTGGENTPLMIAATHDSLNVLKYLIEGCNSDYSADDYLIVSTALNSKSFYVFQYLWKKTDIPESVRAKCVNISISMTSDEYIEFVEYINDNLSPSINLLSGLLKSQMTEQFKFACIANQESFTLYAKFLFHVACSAGNVDAMKYIHSNQKIVLFGVSTSVFAACRSGKVDAVKFFVDLGIALVDTHMDLISIAVKTKSLEVLKYIISQYGPDCKSSIKNYTSILTAAVESGDNEIIKHVLGLCRMAPSSTYGNALLFVTKENNLEAVQLFHSAYPGFTPLLIGKMLGLSAKHSDHRIINYLLSLENTKIPTMFIRMSVEYGDFRVTNLLLKHSYKHMKDIDSKTEMTYDQYMESIKDVIKFISL